MSRPSSTSPTDSTGKRNPRDSSFSSSSVDSVERLRRWAELVAVGEVSLATELTAAELRIVLAEAGRLRRERLVRLIARAIALDLKGGGEA